MSKYPSKLKDKTPHILNGLVRKSGIIKHLKPSKIN